MYARVSTDKQAARELSIPAQIQAMRQYASQRNWSIIHEFIEAGVSARTSERTGLRALLARCREGRPKIDIVLVHKIDRLARNVADHVAIRGLLKQQNIALASVVENLDDSTSGQLVEHIMASLAQFYSANLSEEVKKGMRQKIQQGGWPHLPPLGYRSSHGRINVDPQLGPLVQRAFVSYARGDTTLTALSNRLSGEDHRFSVSGLQRLLRNPFYVGKLRWQGQLFPGRHEALVSPEVFARVQDVLDSRTRRLGSAPQNNRWLRGFATCALCDSLVSSEAHGRLAYYRCRRNAYPRNRCRAKFINVQRADEAVLAVYERLSLPPAVRQSILRDLEETGVPTDLKRDDLTYLQTRSRQIEAAAVELATNLSDGLVEVDVYRLAAARLRDERQQINARLKVLEAIPERVTLKSEARTLLALHHELPLELQQRLLTRVFLSLTIQPVGVASYRLKPPFDVLDSQPEADAA